MFAEPGGWFMDEAFLDLESHYLAAFEMRSSPLLAK
jgi:hypothetical protein